MAINTILVESDMDVIKHFASYIGANFPDIKLVKIFNDPSKNVENEIKALKPKLLIFEMRFYDKRGFATIKRLHDYYPELRFIVYSLFIDDDYMKQSLDYGVIDYMYKPVKPSELNRCLSSALTYFKEYDLMQKAESQLERNYNENSEYFKLIFLTNLVNGNIQNDNEILNAFHYFNFNFTEKYTILIFRVDSFKKFILALDEKEKHLLSYRLMKLIGEKLKSYKIKPFITSFNSVTVLLSGEYDLMHIIEFCEQIKAEEYKRYKTRISVGIGRSYEKPSDIHVSYKEADAALMYRFQMGYNSIIPIHFMESGNCVSYRYPAELQERLVKAAVVGEYEYCLTLLSKILDSLKECGPLPEKLMPKIVMGILLSVNRAAAECGLPVTGFFSEFFPANMVLELVSPEDTYAFLSKTLLGFCEYLEREQSEKKRLLYENAVKYVFEKYNESISVSKIALALETTPEYLNMLFLSNEKKSLFDYIVSVRIEIAKQMIKDTDFDDDFIAAKIGYDDTRYFRSLFKQQEGLSTNEYRNIKI